MSRGENSWLVGGEISVGFNKLCQKDNDSVREWKKHYGAMHFGIGHGADRGKINSILRLEGITDYITITIDDTVVARRASLRSEGTEKRRTRRARSPHLFPPPRPAGEDQGGGNVWAGFKPARVLSFSEFSITERVKNGIYTECATEVPAV